MLAVGSAITIQDKTFVVCGYRPIEQDGHVDMGYLLVGYPLGYVNVDSFTLVSADRDYPVVYKGYRNEDGLAYDHLLEQVRSLGREVTPEAVADAMDEAAAELTADLATSTSKEE